MGGQFGAERPRREKTGREGGTRARGVKTRPNNSKTKQAKRGRAEKEVKESRLRRKGAETRGERGKA